MLAVTAIYLLVNAAFLYVLTPAEMANSPLVAADVAARLVGDAAGALVTVAALFVLVGSLNVNFLALPRVGLVLAQDGLAARSMTRVSGSGTPRPALLVATAVVLAAAPLGSFEDLVIVLMCIVLAVDGLVILALFRLRRLYPEWARPYRVPLYPFLPAAVVACYAALLGGIAVRYPGLSGVALAALVVLGVAGVVRVRALGRRAGSAGPPLRSSS
jgi:APA family basic amino acid/polyamine antiporter